MQYRYLRSRYKVISAGSRPKALIESPTTSSFYASSELVEGPETWI